MKTYTLAYRVNVRDGGYYTGKMRIKNCMGELHAKVRLEAYMKRKHADFQSLIVYDCTERMFGFFGDIFK